MKDKLIEIIGNTWEDNVEPQADKILELLLNAAIEAAPPEHKLECECESDSCSDYYGPTCFNWGVEVYKRNLYALLNKDDKTKSI